MKTFLFPALFISVFSTSAISSNVINYNKGKFPKENLDNVVQYKVHVGGRIKDINSPPNQVSCIHGAYSSNPDLRQTDKRINVGKKNGTNPNNPAHVSYECRVILPNHKFCWGDVTYNYHKGSWEIDNTHYWGKTIREYEKGLKESNYKRTNFGTSSTVLCMN